MKMLSLSVLLLSAATLTAQQPSPRTRDASTTPKAGAEAGATAPKAQTETAADKDREEVSGLIHELETTIGELGKARTQVDNVKRIVDTLDQGTVEATDQELVKTNKFVRQQLAKDFRELRARARNVATQVGTVLSPKQRGMEAKLQTRWDLETDQATKSKIAKLLAEHKQSMVETEDQVKRLEANIQKIGSAVEILENQLSYLELVEESLNLGRKVSEQLKDLNQEIDKVVNSLVEKEVRQ